jgi:hypothetical protein
VLAFGRPRYEAATKENSIARSGAPGIRAAGPISVSVDNKLSRGRLRNDKSMIDGALEVAEDSLGSHKVNFPGVMHVQADLLNGVGNVRPCKSQVLECTYQTPVGCRVSHRRASSSSKFGTRVHRCRTWVATCHAMASENIQDVLPLREE